MTRLPSLLFTIAAIFFIPAAFAAETPSAGTVVGTVAPDFELVDVNGVTHSLSQYKGKPVVLEWFNNGCPFVKKHYHSGNLQKLQRTYTEKGVTWLVIASSAEGKQGHLSNEQAHELIKEWNMAPTAYLVDASGKVGRLYGAKTTPHMFVIDSKGMLVYAGAIDDTPSTRESDIEGSVNYIAQSLDALEKGEPITTASTDPYGCSVKYAG